MAKYASVIYSNYIPSPVRYLSESQRYERVVVFFVREICAEDNNNIRVGRRDTTQKPIRIIRTVSPDGDTLVIRNIFVKTTCARTIFPPYLYRYDLYCKSYLYTNRRACAGSYFTDLGKILFQKYFQYTFRNTSRV